MVEALIALRPSSAPRIVDPIDTTVCMRAWPGMTRGVWGDDDATVLRHRLDVTMQKIRRKLEEGGVRRDLVRAHRDGHLELFLHPGEQADDRG